MNKWTVFILSAGLAVSGFAQTTRTWDAGGGDNVLTTAANWSGDTLPASTSALLAGRQDASWNGSVAGPLSLTYGATLGGSYGIGLVMTAGQTSALNIANSAGTAQILRLVNSTSATVGGIQLASGAGALTIGAAGTANPITLALGQGSSALNYYFANNSANTATIGENVIIEKGGNHTATLIFDGTGSWNVKGVVGALSGTAGAGNVSIYGGSAVTLSGNNTYAGTTDIDNGTVVVKHDNALGTGTIQLSADAVGEVARLQSDGTARTFTNAVTFAGDANGKMYLGGAGTGKLTFNGAVYWGSSTKTYTIDGSTVEFGGAWTGDSTTFTNIIDGTDTATSIVIMKGDRGTAAKQIDIGDKVTVRANHANSFGSNTTEPLNILGATRTGVVELENNITLARTLTVQGRSTDAVAVRNLSGSNSVAISVGDGGTSYNIESAAGTLTVSAVSGSTGDRDLFVTGAGNVTLPNWNSRRDLTMNGTGTLTMGTNSALSGKATVNSGTLFLNAVGGVGLATIAATGGLEINNSATVVTVLGGNAIGQTTKVTVNTGGLLDVRKNNVIGALSGAGTVRGTTTTNYTLTVNNDDGTSTFSGVIEESSSGKLSLIKAGTGALTLGGTNTYDGTTTVSNGTLIVNGKTGAGAVTVNAGAILGGSGTIGGATTVNGMLNPGNSPGKLMFDASLTLGAASTSRFEIVNFASYDVLKNDGGDTIAFTDGSTIVFDTSAYTANVGDSFQVLETWGGYSGTLASLTFVGTDLGGGKSLDTSMFLTNGTVSVVIPEPATIGMLGLGALITLLIRRQQQSVY